MTDEEFKIKVITFMATIHEKLNHIVVKEECDKKCNDSNKRVDRIYWGIFIIIGTVGLIAKVKGLI